MTNDPWLLTIHHAQMHQPWTLPLAPVHDGRVAHQYATHAVLHATKSIGKIATVMEALDHSGKPINEPQTQIIKDMAADLLTIALRFANLYNFDLATELCTRVAEKNGGMVSHKDW
jgi:hypothetical protein